MTTDVFQANMAGRVVRFTFRDAQTRQFFRSWLRPCGEAADLIASPEELAAARALMRETDPPAAVEFKALCGLTGRFLLRWDCCLFHAVAFLFQGRAWLLTAPSGTGKTTQFMNWRKLAASEILMISGDIPVLELREDGIWVHPSPWNGKEAIGSLHSAPLGGIVLLEQGKENRIGRLYAGDGGGDPCLLLHHGRTAGPACLEADKPRRHCFDRAAAQNAVGRKRWNDIKPGLALC